MSQPERSAIPLAFRQKLVNLGLAAATGLASFGFNPGISRAEENATPQPEAALVSTSGSLERSEPPNGYHQVVLI